MDALLRDLRTFPRGTLRRPGYALVVVVTLALACFAVAQSLHGSGFIAAFVGGLIFGYFARERTHVLVLAGEGVAELMAMLTWVIFGAVMVGQFWSVLSWEVLLLSRGTRQSKT